MILLWMVAAASAQDIAVMPFDGYGVTYEDATLTTQGFRDAMLEDGYGYPLSDYDISERLGAGKEAQIAEARSMVSEARALLDAGNPSRALELLMAARTIHEQAGSRWVRRAELADIHFFMGTALLAKNQRTEAVSVFTQTLRLYPAYDTERAPALTPAARSALADAAAEIARGSRPLPPNGELSQLAVRLDADLVVVGHIDGSGALYARMVDGTAMVGEVNRKLDVVPTYPGEPIYLAMVTELTGGAGSVQTVGEVSSASDPYAFVSIPSPVEESSLDSVHGGVEERPAESGARRRSDDSLGEISGASRRAPGSDKLTQQWWFWTATGVVTAGAVGVGVYALAASSPGGEPVEIEGTPTYTIVIE